jgi:hypothetical protein
MIATVGIVLLGFLATSGLVGSCAAQSECAVLTVADVLSAPDPEGGATLCSTYFCLTPPPAYGPSSSLALHLRADADAVPELVSVDTPSDWDAVLEPHAVTWLGPRTSEVTCGFTIQVRLAPTGRGFAAAWTFSLNPVSDECGDTLSVQCVGTPVVRGTWGWLKAQFD